MTPGAAKTPNEGAAEAKLSVTIGILTYQRPKRLTKTLETLAALDYRMKTAPWALHECLVIDNDREPTAEAVVGTVSFPCPLTYVHEPEPGLAAARNRALDETASDILVFIDDDEWAEAGWPDGLIHTMVETGAALVGGPVRTTYPSDTPAWILEGGFFDRDEPPTGTPQGWLRSGNLAIDIAKIREHDLRFDHRFSVTGGEDVDFSRRAAQLGLGLQWNNSAVVVEEIEPERTTIEWLTGRERRATANWVRAERLLDPSRRAGFIVAGRGLVRYGQGVAMVLLSIPTGNLIRRRKGQIWRARGLGSWDGLVAKVRPGLRPGERRQAMTPTWASEPATLGHAMMYQTTTSGPEAARLEDYLRALQRYKWVVVALMLLGVAGAFLFASSRTPTYTATSTLVMRPRQSVRSTAQTS